MRSIRNKILLTTLLVPACFLAGCAAIVSDPESDPLETVGIPRAEKSSSGVSANSLERQMYKSTLRIRNTTCTGLGVGSGIAIGPRTIVTNHHVIDGARGVQINTWDGRTIPARVQGVSRTGDIAIMRVNKHLPQDSTLSTDWKTGDPIYIAGYPEGGPFRIVEGIIGERTNELPYLGKGIIRVQAVVQPGNSGGPVFNDSGEIIGIVVARSTSEPDIGYIISTNQVSNLLKAKQKSQITACRYLFD